jgi:small redox-active disulfide protein 2
VKLQILGTGCPKCKRLTENAEAACRDLGVDADVEKVTDIDKITSYGVLMTPALAVDGEVKSVGKVLSVEEIKVLVSRVE